MCHTWAYETKTHENLIITPPVIVPLRKRELQENSWSLPTSTARIDFETLSLNLFNGNRTLLMLETLSQMKLCLLVLAEGAC